MLAVGIPAEMGIKWAMDPQYPRLMPNFSHGTAGIVCFLASLYRKTNEQKYLEFAHKMSAQILNKASKDDKGMFWVQAEHRTRTDFLQAQTNLMQGAAGIGLWLLRLEEYERGQHPHIVLPDNPFLR